MCWIEGTGHVFTKLTKCNYVFLACTLHRQRSLHSLLLLPPSAIIEHVRDGSVVRALLLPDYYLVTVMLSGIKVDITHFVSKE